MSDIPTTPPPVLVGKDGARTPAQAITRDELLALVKEIITAQGSAEAIATKVAGEVAAQVASDIYDRMEGKNQHGDWNIANYPGRSVFNPDGDHPTLNPRPEIVGHVFWVGTLMDAREHTHAEIELINALRPGRYHGGAWRVVDLAPGQTGTRKLLVLFPCADPDLRSGLPTMVDMLREMNGQAVAAA